MYWYAGLSTPTLPLPFGGLLKGSAVVGVALPGTLAFRYSDYGMGF